jgi:hypothetical protein
MSTFTKCDWRSTVLVSLSFVITTVVWAQTDPGPRGGAAGAGGPISGLNKAQASYFSEGQTRFEDVSNLAKGLGPRFNSTSCSSCHAQPAVGGTSPVTNPQVGVAPPGQFVAV